MTQNIEIAGEVHTRKIFVPDKKLSAREAFIKKLNASLQKF